MIMPRCIFNMNVDCLLSVVSTPVSTPRSTPARPRGSAKPEPGGKVRIKRNKPLCPCHY